jgi:carbon monoxide dehydrogenase subunit G
MKKIWVIVLLMISIGASSQWSWKRIDGNGILKKETRKVQPFTGISSSGSWDVMVAYGNSTDVTIEGDENLLEHIETVVENGKLYIRAKKYGNIRSKNKITVYVTATRLQHLSLSGSGDIIGRGEFKNEGTTNVMVSGSGNIRFEFDQFNEIDVSVSGSGGIKMKGTAKEIEARISGSGNIDCKEVISDDASAHISGSGNIKVHANSSIDVHISGSGNVHYSGGAQNIRTHKNGSGRIVKG